MDNDRIMADGRRRLLREEKVQAELDAAVRAIEDRYAETLKSASFFRRLALRWRKDAEIRREIERLAPSSGLYLAADPSLRQG